MTMNSFRIRMLGGALCLAPVFLAVPAVAAPGERQEFHIPAQPLDTALKAYGAATGRQLLYASELVASARSHSVDGHYDADQALAVLLGASAVRVVRADARVVVLGAKPQPPKREKVKPATAAQVPAPAADAGLPAVGIVVTGSHIRGQSGVSPTIVLDRDAIDRSGYGSVAELIALLPQSFSGQGNEATSAIGTDRVVPNNAYGSSANLRGLGADATLTLVNGRRIAGSGGRGDFTDLSSIPTAAIDRIEVVADGASAIYGSDAVGGVINLILKKNYRGAETRLRYGVAPGTGRHDFQASQLVGTTWDGGSLIASYEYDRRSPLASKDRPDTATADLRRFGGSDFRSFYSVPATVLRFDPVQSAYLPAFAVPDGQNGVGLTPGSFTPGANLTNQRQDTDVLPRQERHGAYIHAEQSVGDRLTFFAEGRFSHRSFELRTPAMMTILPVTAANPYFVSPTGASFDVLGYDFARDIGPLINRGHVTSWSAVAGATWRVGGDWVIDGFASRAMERTHDRSTNIVNASLLYEALGTTPDNPATAYSAARDGYFNPYGSGSSNNPAVLGFIGSGYTDERLSSRLDTGDLKADGSVFDLPGGPVLLAVGGSVRHEHFDRSGSTFYSGVSPAPLTPTDAGRTVLAGYSELSVPIVGAANAVPGIRRLMLSLALRHERYSDFGSSTNPKLGASWSPTDSLEARVSWGTSFRAPAVKERTDPLRASATQLVNANGVQTVVLELSGGNPDLKAERATSWSAGLRWRPRSVPGLRLELNWFRVDFHNQIGQPAYEDFALALRNPAYSPFITFVDPTNNAGDRAKVQALLDTPGAISAGVPVTAFKAIVDARWVNTARLLVQGIDFNAAKDFALGSGRGSVAVNGSWLIDYRKQVTPASAPVERVATVGNPTDFRARATASWDNARYGGTLSLNYVNGYKDNISQPQRSVAAWATLDAQLRYTFTEARWLKGMTIALSVTNLLNTAPPFVNNSIGIGYDPANADPVGRLVSLQLIKRW
jgi:iron complex outermembrane receptor protein